MAWILVVLSLTSPQIIEATSEGIYTSMTLCFEARELYVKRQDLDPPHRAICVRYAKGDPA